VAENSLRLLDMGTLECFSDGDVLMSGLCTMQRYNTIPDAYGISISSSANNYGKCRYPLVHHFQQEIHLQSGSNFQPAMLFFPECNKSQWKKRVPGCLGDLFGGMKCYTQLCRDYNKP